MCDMKGNLSKILLTELQMNIDFMMRLSDNFSAGIFKVPDSFLYHISAKYSIPIEKLQEMNSQIADFLLPIFCDKNIKKVSHVKSETKSKINSTDELPIAKFSNI